MIDKDETNTTKETSSTRKSESRYLLYGVIEWINNNPTLDGMPCFSSKSKALDYAKEKEHLAKFYQFDFDVRYTIIEIHKII